METVILSVKYLTWHQYAGWIRNRRNTAGEHSADPWNMLPAEALGVESRVCHENEEGIYSYLANECGAGGKKGNQKQSSGIINLRGC